MRRLAGRLGRLGAKGAVLGAHAGLGVNDDAETDAPPEMPLPERTGLPQPVPQRRRRKAKQLFPIRIIHLK